MPSAAPNDSTTVATSISGDSSGPQQQHQDQEHRSRMIGMITLLSRDEASLVSR